MNWLLLAFSVGVAIRLQPIVQGWFDHWLETRDWDEIFDDAIECWENGKEAIQEFVEQMT